MPDIKSGSPPVGEMVADPNSTTNIVHDSIVILMMLGIYFMFLFGGPQDTSNDTHIPS